MKIFLQLGFVLFLSFSAAALDDGHVRYLGGTAPGVAAGAVGRLDTTSETCLTFEQAGNKVSIPYTSIDSYEYSKEVTRHLGVLPAVAVALMKMRRHSHFFRITYRDPGSTVQQIVVFEVPKHMPPTLQAILEARAPGRCKPYYQSSLTQPDH
jgi:hypothetical protein